MCHVAFTLTTCFRVTNVGIRYPDVIPGIALREVVGLDDAAQEECMAKLTEEVSDPAHLVAVHMK